MEENMSLGQAQRAMAGIERNSFPSFLARLYGSSDEKVRDFACSRIKQLYPQEVADDVIKLLNCLKEHNKLSKEMAQKMLNEVPGVFLSPYATSLIDSTNDFEIAEVAFSLLRRIPVKDLGLYLEQIKSALDEPGILIRRREMRRLLIFILNSWSMEEKIKNHDYIMELQSSSFRELSSLGTIMHLEILNTWPIADLKKVLHYLVSVVGGSFESEIAYLAAHLAYKFLASEHASQVIRAAYLDFMFQFLGWGHQELRRNFRALALDTLNKEYPAYILPYTKRLIECFDGSVPKERSLAYSLLKKVNPDELPLDLLLISQKSSLYRTKRLTSRLTRKISSQKLAENLELLMKSQESHCRSERDLAARLALRISRKEIKKYEWVLRKHRESKNFFVHSLASELLYFAR